MTDDQGQFANGMNPETDGARGSSALKIVIIIAVIVLALATCCGGCIFGGIYMIDAGSGTVLRPQIEGTPAIEGKIGVIDDIGLDWSATSAQAQSGNDQRIAFTVSGDKGSGVLLVEQSATGLANASWAILEIDGESYVVFGDPPADLGAEVLPGTPTGDQADTGDDLDEDFAPFESPNASKEDSGDNGS